MTQTYRIRRVEDGDAPVDLRSVLKGIFSPARQADVPSRTVTFAAIFDKRMVGTLTMDQPDRRAGTATLSSLDVEATHRASGCPQVLLDVAVRWCRANELRSLEVIVPASPASAADVYLANGFHVVGMANAPAAVVLALRLQDAQPHTDAWYSKHHGAWFATVARHCQ